MTHTNRKTTTEAPYSRTTKMFYPLENHENKYHASRSRTSTKTVWDMGYVGGMVYEENTVCMYVAWYLLAVWYGKHTVCGMVRWWYGTMVPCRGYIVWPNFLVVWYVSVYKVRKGRIRRTNIICNGLIYRPLETVRKCKPCGQTDRQTDRFAFTAAETQFYKLRIVCAASYQPATKYYGATSTSGNLFIRTFTSHASHLFRTAITSTFRYPILYHCYGNDPTLFPQINSIVCHQKFVCVFLGGCNYYC